VGSVTRQLYGTAGPGLALAIRTGWVEHGNLRASIEAVTGGVIVVNLLIALIGAVILIAAVGLGVIGPVSRSAAEAARGRYDNANPPPTRHVAAGLVAALVGIIVLVIGLAGPFVEVPAGEVGVVTNFGQVQAGTLEPGLHVVTPIVQHVTNVDTRVQPHQFQEIDAASAEYQTVRLTGTMNYHVDGQFASDLFQRVGTDFASKVIDPAFNDFIKTVVPTYRVDEILGKRDEIRSQAKDALAANLERYHIVVDDIYIANIAFSPEFQQAIEAKQVAQQQVQTEQQVLAQRRIQAEQAVAQAKGQADANVTLAEGQAKANASLAASLSDKILQYQYIQKLGDKIQVMLVPSGNQFLLDLKGLLGQTSPAAK
jgi:regulator of protease activity HflC (stomatin/prohibitin superfamily)